MSTSEGRSRQLREIAATTFGWTRLTPDQLRAMEQVAAGRDVLAVLPTGAGKSAIHQVPALLPDRPGPTVVVSPRSSRCSTTSGRASRSPPPRPRWP